MTRARKFADLWNRGSQEKALELARVAIDGDVSPAEREAMSDAIRTAVLGSMHLPGGHVTEAAELVASFAAAIEGPDSESAWRAVATLARHHQRNGRLEEALQAAQRANNIAERQPGQPHLSDAAVLAGDLAIAAGRTQEGNAAYRRALVALERAGRDKTNDALHPLEQLISVAEREGHDDDL